VGDYHLRLHTIAYSGSLERYSVKLPLVVSQEFHLIQYFYDFKGFLQLGVVLSAAVLHPSAESLPVSFGRHGGIC
jgi:hypothetical protein